MDEGGERASEDYIVDGWEQATPSDRQEGLEGVLAGFGDAEAISGAL